MTASVHLHQTSLHCRPQRALPLQRHGAAHRDGKARACRLHPCFPHSSRIKPATAHCPNASIFTNSRTADQRPQEGQQAPVTLDTGMLNLAPLSAAPGYIICVTTLAVMRTPVLLQQPGKAAQPSVCSVGGAAAASAGGCRLPVLAASTAPAAGVLLPPPVPACAAAVCTVELPTCGCCCCCCCCCCCRAGLLMGAVGLEGGEGRGERHACRSVCDRSCLPYSLDTMRPIAAAATSSGSCMTWRSQPSPSCAWLIAPCTLELSDIRVSG
ncbi:hypothetical protein COO60DRAFT_1476527 [Scenedesmus sp. NREL 46B-D3]|nr:hypothetical protein COO60DRAFT_1476527 [Scenedesmus sp. NREL 46B-D3]